MPDFIPNHSWDGREAELSFSEDQRLKRLIKRHKFAAEDITKLATVYLNGGGRNFDDGCWMHNEDWTYVGTIDLNSITDRVIGRPCKKERRIWKQIDRGVAIQCGIDLETQIAETIYDEEWIAVRDVVHAAMMGHLYSFLNPEIEKLRAARKRDGQTKANSDMPREATVPIPAP
jgi:hypothetical protein